LATSSKQRGETINQAWWNLEPTADGEGARRPEGAAVSRRQADPAVVKTLKGSVPLGAGRKPGDWWFREAHEGTDAQAPGRRGGETPRGHEKPGGQRPSAAWFTPSAEVTDPHREQSLEGGARGEMGTKVRLSFCVAASQRQEGH